MQKDKGHVETWGGFIAEPRINKHFQNRLENRRRFSPTISPSSVGSNGSSGYSRKLNGNPSPRPSDLYAASLMQEISESGSIDGPGANADSKVASPRHSPSPHYSEDFNNTSDAEMSPSQLKYAVNKPFASGRSQIIHRMLRHGKSADTQSKKSAKRRPRKDYQKIFKEGAEKVVKLNSFLRSPKHPDIGQEDSRGNTASINRVISAPASFSDNLYVQPLSKWKTVYKSSLQRKRHNLDGGKNKDPAESTAKDRHEDSYSLRKSPASFSYPKNPESIASAYSRNKKDTSPREKNTKAWENENYKDHPLYFESNKDAAETVRKNKRVIKPSSRIMRKKYLSAVSKDKSDRQKFITCIQTHSH